MEGDNESMSIKNPKLNASGCRDMTAFEAINNVRREERREAKKREFPKVYICSPFAGDTETNVRNALRYCRFAVKQGKLPIAPHCYFPQFMNDDDPAERELALSFGLRLLYGCRELWIFGNNISPGMKLEIAAARQRGITVKNFNEKMEEITS
jgi:hypothetical protein